MVTSSISQVRVFQQKSSHAGFHKLKDFLVAIFIVFIATIVDESNIE